MRFTDIKLSDGSRAPKSVCSFTLAPTHVAYANTLRRLIMTGVETVAFRADMTTKGTTTDVKVLKNDTPMTNEMLAHRIGLLPINVREPLKWNPDDYTFRLKATANKDSVRDVTCADFEIRKITVKGEAAPKMTGGASTASSTGSTGSGSGSGSATASESSSSSDTLVEEELIDPAVFFPPHPITGESCLIATLTPGSGSIEIVAKATLGTGRENARFQPTSRCTYTYTRDMDAGRLNEHFTRWAQEAKKVSVTKEMSKDTEPLKSLLAEFNTMEVNRVYRVDEKGEPFSFDFVIRSIGILEAPYILQRACDVGEAMVARYANIDTADLTTLPEVTLSPADSRLVGFDFLFKGHDHTLGNLLQTWLVENHMDAAEGSGKTPITYAGYTIPHPLRDEMLLRIGVADGKEETARKALAEACAGCAEMFRQMKTAWVVGTAESGGMSRMDILREMRVNTRGTIATKPKPAVVAAPVVAAPAASAAAPGAGAGTKPLRGAAKVPSAKKTAGVTPLAPGGGAAGAGAPSTAPPASAAAAVEAARKALVAAAAKPTATTTKPA